jgi:hypothetical protein
VRVNGTAFDSGGAYRCRFADAGETEASRMDDETLTCLSPAAAVEGTRALEVSLNARDFTASNVTFGFYSHPDTASVYPQNGPVAGATTVAVRSVASGGMANLARKTSLNRENLYRSLSKKGNPKLSSLASILDAVGIKLYFAPTKKQRKAA